VLGGIKSLYRSIKGVSFQIRFIRPKIRNPVSIPETGFFLEFLRAVGQEPAGLLTIRDKKQNRQEGVPDAAKGTGIFCIFSQLFACAGVYYRLNCRPLVGV
jgi:hypothetical protein